MPESRRANEALIGREDGRLLAACDRCGTIAPPERMVTVFRTAQGEKTDFCQRCVK